MRPVKENWGRRDEEDGRVYGDCMSSDEKANYRRSQYRVARAEDDLVRLSRMLREEPARYANVMRWKHRKVLAMSRALVFAQGALAALDQRACQPDRLGPKAPEANGDVQLARRWLSEAVAALVAAKEGA